VALVGAGNSAGQAVVYLASQVSKVSLLVRGQGLASSMSRYLVDRIAGLSNVELLTETTITGIEGRDGMLEQSSGEQVQARKCATQSNIYSSSSEQSPTPIGSLDPV
jgi:thioredoxin reductase